MGLVPPGPPMVFQPARSRAALGLCSSLGPKSKLSVPAQAPARRVAVQDVGGRRMVSGQKTFEDDKEEVNMTMHLNVKCSEMNEMSNQPTSQKQ